ncbi:uncharacterized protein LOC129730570 [Wyeomyia smithii]|uniref:uncharacterized protein LOC129730570 n=1 Tax=Wyeomyia smithii TaxID=174621 RepID=UPI0024681A8C|nr:uncharacterized protein LOC129730570 [Wyeomyia smithii]XP_055545976.1 uncharacterized protein LOC129730570 [Wyeomyia smithii]XP_055545977.1 uncharacterized protein LOC129730570 [Wyeomyia smithii]XP_055545978.1 uncharacterized protein LOC129730570 [Wyeomyia smithii]XP_055545979.1 uncharacterized protein LOC129730570 [Wyeomyia smithii]
MAPKYEVSPTVSPVESIHCDSESEYEMIRDDESIEVISEPEDSPYSSLHSSVTIPVIIGQENSDSGGCEASNSDGQEDTDSGGSETKSEENVDASEKTTGDSGVGTGSEEMGGKDDEPNGDKEDSVMALCSIDLRPSTDEETGEMDVITFGGRADVDNEEKKQEDKQDKVDLDVERTIANNSQEQEQTVQNETISPDSEFAIDGVNQILNANDERENDNQSKERNTDNNGIGTILEETKERDDRMSDFGAEKLQSSTNNDFVVVDENNESKDIEKDARRILSELVNGIQEKMEGFKLDEAVVKFEGNTSQLIDTMNQQKQDDNLEMENSSMLSEQSDIEQGEECGMLIKYLDEIRIFRSGRECIKKKVPTQKRVDQLGFSARLLCANLDIKLYNEGSLMSADDNFLAKVRIISPSVLDQTTNFIEAKKVLFQHLQIVRVLQDDLAAERKVRKQSVLKAIQTVLKQSSGDEKLAVDRIQLFYIINDNTRMTFTKLIERIKNNQLIRRELRCTAESFLQAEACSNARDKMLEMFGYRPDKTSSADIISNLRKTLKECSTTYRTQLVEKAPICLHKTLGNIGSDRILFIQTGDIKLFSDMTGVLNESMFQKPLADLAARWTDHMGKIKIKKLLSVEPQTNPIYYFLAKSLEELIIEISSKTDHTVKDLLTSNHSGWHPIKKINWKSENVLTTCLEREYYFIFKLLKHFDLGSESAKQPFDYTVQLFEGPKHQPTWKKLVRSTKKYFGFGEVPENSLNISDENYVWYCLLDDVLYHILPSDYKFDCFEKIIQGYTDFLTKAGRDQLETLRVMTHNTARFIVQTMAYVGQTDNSSIDRQILQKQLDLINTKAIQHSLTSNSFRDLVDVFNMYWKNREDIITGLCAKICLPEMASLKAALLEIVSVALDKNVIPDLVVSFFRSFGDLMVDLNDIQFDWYVKAIADVSMSSLVDLKLIELVDNKWATTVNKTYRVTAVEKFARTVPVLFDNCDCQKHYILEILLTMMSYIRNQLAKTNWKSGEQLSEIEQISTTNELIFAVRNSFLYLSEQPEYVSFEMFYDERVKPFASAVDNSSSHRDFTNRIYLIKESFWYIRKQSEMAVGRALELFDGLNSDSDREKMLSVYQKYDDCFQRFMNLSNEEYIAKAEKIVNKVLELSFIKLHPTWDSDDKLEKIPEMLAGLAAVWSIIVSKDVSNTGKYLTPHCVQILCILRLLSIDRATDGVINHLAQVLTGQGKSLVLGLTAALLALTGHKTRVVCYNEYLVTRDEQDFQQFFSMFRIGNRIIYGTFEDMANHLIAPVINGERMGMRDLLTKMLLGNDQSKKELATENMSNSVLLIDEVDVFFTAEFFGNVYLPCTRLTLPGLNLIQEEIWNIVLRSKTDNEREVAHTIYRFITLEKMKGVEEFHNFINNEKHYNMLTRCGKLTSERFTNKKLFDDHLKAMISCAVHVRDLPVENWKDYKLSERGTILYNRKGKYVNYCLNSYYPVFNYFRLRGSNFVTTVGTEINYGYLNLECGSISYAILPKCYPLILGVSGTLSALNQCEKQTIENLYNISKTSIMPTFFGGSNLRFNQSADFRVLNSLSEWEAAIFARVNAILGENRSVLVFFDSETPLNRFHAEYCGQFDRLNVLTVNTEQALMSQYIDEAGVAKTITLATAAMGRGVDYKSSVAIEKHGGLHVIQTFFSLDVKEETQIMGRTARKDNRGSYELIVCQQHLNGLCATPTVYSNLQASRLHRAVSDNERLLTTINNYKNDHDITMDYMKSFFK